MTQAQNQLVEPTHSCFDDAFAFFLENSQGPDADRDLDHLRLVHGICAPPGSGQRYMHAWVEDKHTNHQAPLVWQGAILKGQNVWVAVTFDSFYPAYGVEQRTRYTFEKAIAAVTVRGNAGPWRPEYRALQDFPPGTASSIPLHRVPNVVFVKVVRREIVL